MWVDMTVYEARHDLTIFDLHCSRRLREEKEPMYQGIHPFHLQVAMPPGTIGKENNGKFDVNWKKEFDQRKKFSLFTLFKRPFNN